MEYFNRFLNNILSENFNENKHLLACEDFNTQLHSSISICEQYSDKITEGGGEEDYWFIVLEQLYDISYKLRDQEFNTKVKEHIDDFMKKISKDIRELLEKMSPYVSMQTILNVLIRPNIYRMLQKNIKQLNLKSLKIYC